MKYTLPCLITLSLFTVVSAQENLVRNGNFTDNTIDNWDFSSNGAQATATAQQKQLVISIDAYDEKESAPQIVQRAVAIASGEGYTLSFYVSADDTGTIRAFVTGEENIFYSDTTRGKVAVSTVGKSYSLSFFIPKANGNARIVFNCGLSKHLTSITLDSISLVRNTKSMISITEPQSGARWISDSERHIVWQNSGVLEVVRILFSSDNGATWVTITDAASNRKNFWWNIPADLSSTDCRIIVGDTGGTVADTSGVFCIVAAGTIDAREMLKNGDFFDTTNWYFSVNGPAKASGAFENDEYVITVDSIGEQPWQVKLEQPGLTLENGSMYRFTFDAYASHERQMFANIGADNGNPSWSVFGGDSIPVTITTTRKTYYQTILMKYPTSGNIRVEFNCANDTGKLFIDNVSLMPIAYDDVLIFAPSLGTVLKSGNKTTIKWHAAEVPTINLEYSIDSGKTWVVIDEGIYNLGTLSWNVPDVSSRTCFIRIRDTIGDTVIGQSSPFTINTFGIIVPDGELVVNGAFNNNTHGWNTRFDGAQGQGTVENQMFRLSVDQPGDALTTIILSQTDLPVLSDKEYTLSCLAFSNGTREMGIKVISGTGAVALLDTIVTLPMLQKTIDFTFMPETDAIVRIEFLLGGSRADVYLDDVSFYTGPDSSVGTAGYLTKETQIPRFGIFTKDDCIVFSTPDQMNGLISLYTLSGRRLRTLHTNGIVTVWNKKSDSGIRPARGSYLARYMCGTTSLTKGFILR